MTISRLSEYFLKLESTSSRIEMTKHLAALFSELSDEDITAACYLLQGRVAPLYAPIEFGVATQFMIRAIAAAYGVSQNDVGESFGKTGDLGNTAEALHIGEGTRKSVQQVYQDLKAIALHSGIGSQEQKVMALAQLLSAIDAPSARFVARIPLGKLRLGFSDQTMLDALSWMVSGDKSHKASLERAYNVHPDIGHIAHLVKTKGIAALDAIHASVGTPILVCLCQRIGSTKEMIEKMGEVAVEPKYDGTRVQIHVNGDSVKTFSRNLEDTTDMFPELEGIRKQLDTHEVILDSEAVAVDEEGNIGSFQETMTRKRKHDIAQKRIDVPLKFYVYDVLYVGGEELLNTPLSDRRNRLKKIVRKGGLLEIAPQIVTRDHKAITAYHKKQRDAGLEGIIVKKWDGPYTSGRRGYNWVKLKEDEGTVGKLADTIDTVIMGYYTGEGKRSTFGIGAFLVGVRSGDTFVTITKIGTGVTDAQWKALYTKLKPHVQKKKPKEYPEVNRVYTPSVWVEPAIVAEIAGDDLTKSPTHGAGIAIRFPRLVKLREDKSPAQATTVKEVKQMYTNQ